jgi:peptidyl-tRNA hydrolase, PTH1 family
MKLIVGLGNPGRQYQRTPHNVGFEVVDLLAERHRGTWAFERRFEAETSEIEISGTRTTLMKPMTYMNLSGNAVGGFAQKNGCEPHEIFVISDDINLPVGRVRLRPGGSHGGHKGLLSIINGLGTLEFPRLRIGVMPPDVEIRDWISFVLQRMRPEDREVVLISIQDAADAIEMLFRLDLASVMNKYNQRKDAQAE